MAYEYQEFPMMIYHANEKEKVITTLEELNIAMQQGWSRTPIKMLSEQVNGLKEQLVWHENEIQRIKKELDEIVGVTQEEEKAEDTPTLILNADDVEEPKVLELTTPVAEETPVIKEPVIQEQEVKSETPVVRRRRAT